MCEDNCGMGGLCSSFVAQKGCMWSSTAGTAPKDCLWRGRVRAREPVGSFSNDDGDGNEDFKKAIGLLRKTNNFARVARFFVHFFTVLARLRRENA